MKKKDGLSRRAGDFFAGSGFYLVLLLCVAVIGVSAWAMFARHVPDGGPDIPVLGEAADWAQLPPNVPTFGGVTATPTPTLRPREDETFFGLGEREEPTEAPAEEPSEAPAEVPTYTEPEPLRFVWPVSGEVEVPHSLDQLIFDRTMGDWRTHAGVDIRADLGETVLSVADGTVERIFHDDLLGTVVTINHGQGILSLYANLMEKPVVEVGQQVTMGMPIGAVGATALVKSGVVHHLHLEMFENGMRVDPLLFLPDRNL